MPRYIDADALMAQLNRKKAEPCNKRYTEGFNDALMRFRSMVHSAPTVSPDEVRGVGKWIRREKVRPNLQDDSDYEFECSCCGWRDLHNAKMIVPYCWHCGAKMEVSDDA